MDSPIETPWKIPPADQRPPGQPERVTQNQDAHEQLLYFTSTSLWSDDSHLVFLSDATGHPNVRVRNLSTGEERWMTDNAEGVLKSYVYFDGQPYRGLGKASLSLHAASGTLYYIQGREIRKADADGKITMLAQVPGEQMTAFTHVSADGKRLCVPTTDARSLDGDLQLAGKPPYDIDQRVREEGLSSWLHVYDTTTGEELVCEEVPSAWVTHVQFAPHNSDLILYNHEWASDKGIRRMWLFDGKKHIRLRTEGGNRSRRDWVCHEMWERDGRAIIYHGGFDGGATFIGRVHVDGSGLVEIPLPDGFKRYGHFTVGNPGELVSDGYYEEVGDKATQCGDWISHLKVDWERGTGVWTPVCRNSSSWATQDEHPHPIFDHGLKFAYFTSDKDGKRAVYRVVV
jgi:oligogalacturonide lyase